MFHGLRKRGIPILVVLLQGVALASCVSNPSSLPAQSGTSQAQSSVPKGYSGRLQVIVTDQNADYLDRATVDLRSTGKDFWRRSGTTDALGTVNFRDVPPQVEISVLSQYGSYSTQATVPQSGGTVEARIIVQTFGADQPQDDQTDPNAPF
jgi:hypothetical protein